MKSTLWSHYWVYLFLLSALSLVLGSGVSLMLQVGKPFAGLFFYESFINNRYNIIQTTPPWWIALQPQYFLQADIVVEIEGLPFTSANAQAVYTQAHQQNQAWIEVVVQRAGQRQTLSAPVVIFGWQEFFDAKFSFLIVGICFWLLAIRVYHTRTNEKLNRVVAIYCACMMLACGLQNPSLYWHDSWWSKLIDLIFFISIPFACTTTIHLALLFPQPSPILQKNLSFFGYPVRLMPSLYGLAYLTLLFYVASRIMLWGGDRLLALALDWVGFHLLFLYLPFAMLAAIFYQCWRIYHYSHSYVSKRYRNEAILLAIGFLGIAPITLVSVWNALSRQHNYRYFLSYVDLRYFYLAVPAAVVAIIVRYQTFRRPTFDLLLVLITSIACLFASIVTGIFLFFATANTPLSPFHSTTPLTPFIPICVTLFFSGLLWGTQRTWQNWFGKFLYWGEVTYADVERFVQSLGQQPNEFNLVSATITQSLYQIFALERSALWHWHAEKKIFQLVSQSGVWAVDPPANLTQPSHLFFDNKPFRLQPTPLPIEWHGLLDQVEVMVPLFVAQQVVGMLAIGKRQDSGVFDERDLRVLEVIGQQSALSLLTSRQISELQRVPQLLDEAQEKARNHIARDLHDSTQQFFGALSFALTNLKDIVVANPQQAGEELEQWINQTSQQATSLRRIIRNLSPLELEMGFTQALHQRVERFKQDTGCSVHAHWLPDLDEVLPRSIQPVLYRVIEQSLDNVKQHAHASRFTLSFQKESSHLQLIMADNGLGFTLEQEEAAEQQGHVGLIFMKTRIEGIGGSFKYVSVPQQGTTITVKIPYNGSPITNECLVQNVIVTL